MSSDDFKYRPDIDGLRAVAVCTVLLFHANLGVAGGYVGVDVFFVISGFLISGIILKEQRKNHFSLLNFWTRRIRRILPASTCMAAIVLIAGYFLMLPEDYESLADSAIAHQLLSSNIYAWKNTGYFDGASELKPLLHTWSLAVEEQFYLGYPFLLVALKKFRPIVTMRAIAGLGIVSFVLSQYCLSWRPHATFFLLPTRAWELFLGGAICLLASPRFINRFGAEVLSWLSMIAIVASALVLTVDSAFPGANALAPCLGSAVYIYANTYETTSVAKLLSLKPVVGIGLISYSLYLWHWPIFAYLRYVQGSEPTAPVAIVALAVAFILGWLSWRYIEQPFRKGSRFVSRPRTFYGAAAAITCCLLLAATIRAGSGFPDRLSESGRRLYDSSVEPNPFSKNHYKRLIEQHTLPTLGKSGTEPVFVVWGDSHAQHLLPGIDEAAKQANIAGYYVTYAATAPLKHFPFDSNYGLRDKAERFATEVLEFVDEKELHLVILAGLWSSYAEDADFEDGIHDTVGHFTEKGVHVAVVRDVAKLNHNPNSIFLKSALFGHHLSSQDFEPTLVSHRQRNKACDEILLSASGPMVTVVDPAPFFENEQGRWTIEKDGLALYRDDNHLSVSGGKEVTPLFVSLFKTLRLVAQPEMISAQ